MPKAAERDTREEILHLAMELTQTQSFNWLSYQDLSERLEIRKASIHYHFPTKKDLGLELVRSYRAKLFDWMAKIEARQMSPVDKLDAYIEFFRKLMGKGDRICPGGTFCSEWTTLPDEMKNEVKALMADHRRFLEAMIKDGRKSGEFSEKGTVDDQIALVGSCLQGALQISRAQGAVGAFNAATRQLKAMLLK